MTKKSLYILSSALLLSCSSSRYLAELPYHYPTDAFYKAVLAQKKQINEQYTLVDDKGENLSDKELALREKYSIILAVPPKKITNYKLYAFIDEWIGTPYKEKTLENKKEQMPLTLYRHCLMKCMKLLFPRFPMASSALRIYSFSQGVLT